MNKELEELKIEKETHRLIDANSTCSKCQFYKNATTSSPCSSCENFEREINDSKNVLAKFTFGRNNLDILLGKKRCVFDKAGLGYNPKGQQNFYKNFFSL